MATTTIAVSGENHHYLSEFKRKAGLPSLDAALEQLFRSGEHRIERIWSPVADEVTAVCKRRGVRRLVAFGSRVWGAPRPNSDVDLAYDVDDAVSLFDLMDLQDELSAVFGLPVDLVSLAAAPPRLRERIAQDGVVLIA